MKKNWVLITLFFVIVVAFGVRFYHFDEWLYFKMDQSRDALLVSNALENGPGYLPLLGPRVGAVKLKHGFLRLGPIYYYFQYASGKIFNSTHPAVFAYPELFFSIAVLPLLFLFLRLYFSPRHAVFITAMYAFSFLIIQYSRFAWNPNPLQFFIILSFYGLLRYLNDDSSRKKWWLILWALGMTIGSQLHFFGFFSLLGISGLLILFHLRVWQREVLKGLFQWSEVKKFLLSTMIALGVVLIFYSPVIISDTMRGGQNSKNFIEALTAKADKKPLTEKVWKGIEENLNYYCLLTTSQCTTSDYRKNLFPIAVTGSIILAGLCLAVWRLRTVSNPLARDFIMLSLLWFSVFAILTIPVAFQLRPRFYIVVFALPFIFLGFLYQFLEERYGKRALLASAGITVVILLVNAYGTMQWFKEQAQAQVKAVEAKRTLILKTKDGVTLGQLQSVTDWMYARHQAGATLYYYVKPEHVRPLQFLFHTKYDTALRVETLSDTTDPHAQFFAVTPAKNELTPVTDKFGQDITVLDSKKFGELMVYELNFPKRVVDTNFRFNKPKTKTDRVFWKDVFGLKENANAIEIDNAE